LNPLLKDRDAIFWFGASCIALWLAFFLYVGIVTHTPGPEGDDWDIVYSTEKIESGSLSLNELTEQYYGAHRLAAPRLLFYLEYKIFQGRGIFTALFGLVFLCLSFSLVASEIIHSGRSRNQKLLLLLIGVMLIFNPAQLQIINSQLDSLVRMPIIFLALLAARILARQYHHLDLKTTALLLLLGCLVLFFDLFGIFIIAAVLTGSFLGKSLLSTRLFCIFCSIMIAAYFAPGKIILHLGTETLLLTAQDFVGKIHTGSIPFFPGYFVFLFDYLGTLAKLFSDCAGIVAGIMVLCAAMLFMGRTLKVKNHADLFFAIFLFILFIHAIGASVGRYQDHGNNTLSRFYVFNCWILWMISIYIVTAQLKYKSIIGIAFFGLLFAFSAQRARDQFQNKLEMMRADVNIVNGSYFHDAYNKISFPHQLFNYNPVAWYDSFLRQRHWGIYATEIQPTAIIPSGDVCVARKIHEFIVSEKKFYEFKLDAWNLTRNKYLEHVYARNTNGEIVATGMSIPIEPDMLPVSWLPRDKVLVYLIIPRQYPLSALTLFGGNAESLCQIQLKAKDDPKE
jgi:hypothetical protein